MQMEISKQFSSVWSENKNNNTHLTSFLECKRRYLNVATLLLHGAYIGH